MWGRVALISGATRQVVSEFRIPLVTPLPVHVPSWTRPSCVTWRKLIKLEIVLDSWQVPEHHLNINLGIAAALLMGSHPFLQDLITDSPAPSGYLLTGTPRIGTCLLNGAFLPEIQSRKWIQMHYLP